MKMKDKKIEMALNVLHTYLDNLFPFSFVFCFLLQGLQDDARSMLLLPLLLLLLARVLTAAAGKIS